MSTQASIAVQFADGHVEAVYCHYDGYLDGVGRTLLAVHNSQEAAEALVGLGDLSSVIGRVRAYHRDRDEAWEDVQPMRYADRATYLARYAGQVYGYGYLFVDSQWLAFGQYDGLTNEPRPVSEMLARLTTKPVESAS